MNAAVRSFVRNCIYRGDTVYGIHDGIEGLVEGNVRSLYTNTLGNYSTDPYTCLFGLQIKSLGWSDVTGWVCQGGAFLGTKRTLPEGKYAQIAARIREYKIQALLVIGGFEVLLSTPFSTG